MNSLLWGPDGRIRPWAAVLNVAIISGAGWTLIIVGIAACLR